MSVRESGYVVSWNGAPQCLVLNGVAYGDWAFEARRQFLATAERAAAQEDGTAQTVSCGSVALTFTAGMDPRAVATLAEEVSLGIGTLAGEGATP